MKCLNCNMEMKCEQTEHHFTESGLDNIYLMGVERWTCDCGEEIIGIPALAQLHDLIGKNLLFKNGLLTGQEIRFLRKNIGMSATTLAKMLDVTKETVSRWENDKLNQSSSHDRALRFLYAMEKGYRIESRERFIALDSKSKETTKLKIPRDEWSKLSSCPASHHA